MAPASKKGGGGIGGGESTSGGKEKKLRRKGKGGKTGIEHSDDRQKGYQGQSIGGYMGKQNGKRKEKLGGWWCRDRVDNQPRRE